MLLFTIVSCSKDDDNNASETQITWEQEHNFIYEYNDGFNVEGIVKKCFKVEGESGNILIYASIEDNNEDIIDIQSKTFSVEKYNSYYILVRCRCTFSNNTSDYLSIDSPQSSRKYLLEFKEVELNSIELIGIEPKEE